MSDIISFFGFLRITITPLPLLFINSIDLSNSLLFFKSKKSSKILKVCILTRTSSFLLILPFINAKCCVPSILFEKTCKLNNPKDFILIFFFCMHSTKFSLRILYSIKSFMEDIFNLCFIQNFFKSFNLAIEPSSFIISQITPPDFLPESLAKSTAASV